MLAPSKRQTLESPDISRTVSSIHSAFPGMVIGITTRNPVLSMTRIGVVYRVCLEPVALSYAKVFVAVDMEAKNAIGRQIADKQSALSQIDADLQPLRVAETEIRNQHQPLKEEKVSSV